MPSHFRISLLFATLLTGVLLVWGAVQATPMLAASTGEESASVPKPTALPNRPASSSPDISAIDSPTPACVLLQAHTGVCYMTWSYMWVNADPNYVITMTLSIDNQPRARYTGFFQTSMYVPMEMTIFNVPCGSLGSGGDPDFGASHSFAIHARDSAGLASANYGTVYCPADERLSIFMPILSR
jgi:hypothetical protein